MNAITSLLRFLMRREKNRPWIPSRKRTGNKAENGRIVNCHISLRLKQPEKQKSECFIIKCEQRQFSNRSRIVSSGSRWSIKCQGWLLHTPSRPVPSCLLERQHDFSALPQNASTRNTWNESTKQSGNPCHVQHLGRNKNICSQHESY